MKNISNYWNCNIIFEKIWIDSNLNDPFFQARITVSNENIIMSAEVYIQPQKINTMVNEMSNLLNNPLCVILGNNDDSGIDCVIFNFTKASKLGHIEIGVYMKSWYRVSRDQKATNDTANLHLQTDISSLDEFSNNLSKFIESDIGTIISLHVLPE